MREERVGGDNETISDRSTDTEASERRRIGRLLRWVLPFLVSAALLAWVLSRMDVAAVFEKLTLHVGLVFVPTLLVFVAVALFVEAICLVLVVSQSVPFPILLLAARIKAASYLLSILNYALGAGALTVLLRRRARMPLAEAAGSVFVISLFDLGSLVGFVIIGLALLGTDAPGVQAGVVVLAGAAMAAGLAFLRAPLSMGPLEPLRELAVFRAARTLPIPAMLKLAALRAFFVALFISMTWATLLAFEVHVPTLPLVVNTCVMLLVAALPIAAAGLGTGQVVFVALFERWAPAETLLAASLLLSFGMIVTRSTLGLLFAREFASEAIAHRGEGDE
jgi:hypothetical protein